VRERSLPNGNDIAVSNSYDLLAEEALAVFISLSKSRAM
jgi:hypothetical protein